MMIVLILFLTGLLACGAVGGYLFYSACPRKPEKPWLDREALAKTPYGPFYDHIAAGKAWLEAHDAQPVSVTSHDGLKLHGLWVPAENARGTMLLIHGYHSCVLSDFGPVLDFYHNVGMNLLLPDQRAHGKSEGRFTTFGVKESMDMKIWIEHHNTYLAPCPMVLSGLSMGASTMMYLADQQLPGNVKGIIADCGFTSPGEILGDVFTQVTKLPAWPFLWATDLCARLFAGFRLNEKTTLTTLANTRLPIVMVHGLEDTFVPWKMTQRGYDACCGDKQLFLVPEASHGVSYFHARETYQAMLTAFLGKVLEDGK